MDCNKQISVIFTLNSQLNIDVINCSIQIFKIGMLFPTNYNILIEIYIQF